MSLNKFHNFFFILQIPAVQSKKLTDPTEINLQTFILYILALLLYKDSPDCRYK